MAVELGRGKDNPSVLKTLAGSAEYSMHLEENDGKQVLLCSVGSTVL